MAGIRIKDVGTNGVSTAEIIHIDSGVTSHDAIACKKATVETFSIDVNGLPISTSGDLYQYMTVNIGDVAADSDAIVPGIFVPKAAITLYAIDLSVDTDIGDDNVNYQSIDFKDSAANSILSAPFTTDVEWTAGTLISAGALDGTHKILAADEDVYMTFTKTASGKAMSGLKVHLTYQYTG